MTDPTVDYATPPARRPPGQYVLPASGACLIIGFAMMICSPITALNLSAPPMPPEIAAMDPMSRPAPPPVRVVDAVAVLTLFTLGTLGTVGGLLGLARLTIGRWALLVFCPLTLLYLTVMVGYRLTGGLGDVVDSAPTRSAAGLFFVCTGVTLAGAAVALAMAWLYLLKPEVAATFRTVTFGDPDDRAR